MRKILVLSASVGSGHGRAGDAVRAAASELDASAAVKHLDVLELAGPAFRAVYSDAYLKLACSAPHLLGSLYDAFDRPASLPLAEPLRLLMQRASLSAFPRLLAREAPDVLVCTHFLPAELASRLKRLGRLSVPLAVVVTDFDAHRLWVQAPCERYFVASPEAAASLAGWGVGAESVSITGIPIDPRFGRLHRGEVLRRLGLSGERPIVLQLSGGSGVGPMEQVFEWLLKVPIPMDLVVVTGRNESARRRLSGRPPHPRHGARILGFTDRLHDWMAAADLVVTKPGGLTTSEALACGTPLVMIDPIPGQETRNSDYVLENGAGVKANSLAGLAYKVEVLLEDRTRLARMRRSARALGRPVAAFEIAQAALDLAQRGRGQAQDEKACRDLRPAPQVLRPQQGLQGR
ncbi:MAG: glycosyltransferase [Elusimicrobia bacterium]|nr:glycosyltransferase [Elusimicrobiota bacterium]MDE2237508.1 glycosyltransferase [Elusimicrobiota bacterium]MDE2426524.1 glycosyltransferase [Elusimicrobiota bacterium]